jgi:steroid delta-isomerase-like uncharacterized protein
MRHIGCARSHLEGAAATAVDGRLTRDRVGRTLASTDNVGLLADNRKGAAVSEENKALARRVVEEVWNRGNVAVVDEAFAEGYTEHNPRPGQDVGIDGYKGGVTMMRTAFPDLHLDLQDLIAEGDRVALRYTLHGTHEGELMGIAPTGNRVASDGMVFARVQDGRIAERWGVQDVFTILQQVGAIPAPASAAR